ncbi:MAG: CapA family protein [Lachnospiraceae bacterium]|nr:CapA family protein [Lachnospiraceae bacterium]
MSYWRWGSWGFEKEDAEVSFVVFGDNLIHEPIYTYGLNHGGNFDFLYENVKEKIAESDIAVINQETPFVKDSAEYGDYPRFGTPMQVGEAIAEAGFDVVTCATNHALDRGASGVHTTKEFFTSHDILCPGIQTEKETERKPYEIIMRKGAKFALFNYTYGLNGNALPENCPFMVHLLENEQQVREDIKKAREEADFVLVFVHWGTENSTEIDDFQKKWADVFLDSKVDVVVGSHPHVLQPFEMLEREDGHKMLVYYSIGNFVSAQPEKSCEKGGMAEFMVVPGKNGYEIAAYNLRPLTILWQTGGGYTTILTEDNKEK